MERLTERTADGILVKENHVENGLRTFYQCFGEKPNDKYTNCDGGYCAIEKLAAYEDDEEQGLLLRLPCKVGDTLYCITPYVKEPIITAHVLQMNIKQFYNKRIIVRIDVMNKMGESCYFLDDIGKKIFLSREEAEGKLAEMEGAE